MKDEVNANPNAQVDWGDRDITLLKSFPDLTVEVTTRAVCNRALRRHLPGTHRYVHRHHRHQEPVARPGGSVAWGLVRPNIHVKVLEDGCANRDIALADTSAVEETPPVPIPLPRSTSV